MKTEVVIAGVGGRMGREVARAALAADDIILLGGLESSGYAANGGTLRALGLESDAPVRSELGAIEADTAASAGGSRRRVMIEFCGADGFFGRAREAAAADYAIVSGSTGFAGEALAAIAELAVRVPVIRSANFSRGALALIRYGATLAATLGPGYDVEVIETHHRGKQDAPSGTAIAMVDAIRAADAVRGGAAVVYGRSGRAPRAHGEIGVHAVRAGEVAGEHRLVIAGEGEVIELMHRVSGREAFAAGALAAARIAAALPPGRYEGIDILMPVEAAGL